MAGTTLNNQYINGSLNPLPAPANTERRSDFPTLILALDVGQTTTRVLLRQTEDSMTAFTGTERSRGVDAFQLPGVMTDRPIRPQLERLLRRALKESGLMGRDVAGAALGVSGLTHVDAGAADLLARVEDTGLRRLHLAHDSVTAALGVLGTGRGAVVASGTGAVTLAVGTDGVARVDGWGNIMGDAGSAWWIGRRGLEAAMRAHDGRGPSTSLTEALRSRWPDMESAYIRLQNEPERVRNVASFATAVTHVAPDDDVAATICREAGAELARSVATALHRVAEPRIGEPARVACLGGVFQSSLVFEAFLDEVTERVGELHVLSSDFQGVDGAAMMEGLDSEHPLRALISHAQLPDKARTHLYRVDNEPRSYSWGQLGGISRLRGRNSTGDAPQAELWLGAHQLSPSKIVDDAPWADLAQWERHTGQTLPYLFKLLTAATPLSLQAHPSAKQAEHGFQREETNRVRRDAQHRNYPDPHAKSEMLVALEDGFEALCGFRPVDQTLEVIEAAAEKLMHLHDAGEAAGGLRRWQQVLRDQGPATCLQWLLDGGEEPQMAVDELLAAAETCAPASTGESSTAHADASAGETWWHEWALVRRLQAHHPGDPGIAVALMLNRLNLAAGESLWIPTGTIHAYLRGIGAEVMTPSDNVLRGGLTAKHVDVSEFLAVIDSSDATVRPRTPQHVSPAVAVHRPPKSAEGTADFQLAVVTDDAHVATPGAALIAALEGEFAISFAGQERHVSRGDLFWLTGPSEAVFRGSGRILMAMPFTQEATEIVT